MAENGKTKIILTIIIGLFGVMCFGFALTVTEKYKSARDKVTVLERNIEAGKEEVLKVPAIREQLFAAEDSAKAAQGELEEVTEELDELTEEYETMEEELASAKEELESAGGESEEGGSEELEALSSELEEVNGRVAALTEEKEELQSRLEDAENTVASLEAASAAEGDSSGHAAAPTTIVKTKIVTVVKAGSGGTFNGQYSVDPNAEKSFLAPITLHRGLGKEFVAGADKEKCEGGENCSSKNCPITLHRGLGKEYVAKPCKEKCESGKNCSENSVFCLIKEVNAHLDALNGAANAHESIRSRIGENSIKTVKATKASAVQKCVANKLNELLKSYTALCDIVANCDKLTTWDRGNAKSSLEKRISVYVGQLLSINETGEFNTDEDVKLLLSKIQTEQKYFSKI